MSDPGHLQVNVSFHWPPVCFKNGREEETAIQMTCYSTLCYAMLCYTTLRYTMKLHLLVFRFELTWILFNHKFPYCLLNAPWLTVIVAAFSCSHVFHWGSPRTGAGAKALCHRPRWVNNSFLHTTAIYLYLSSAYNYLQLNLGRTELLGFPANQPIHSSSCRYL